MSCSWVGPRSELLKAPVLMNFMTKIWRHNGRDGVSSHQPHDCLLNRLFRHRTKKTSKFRVTGLCEGNSPVTPTQRASNAENVSIWWRNHDTLPVVVNTSPKHIHVGDTKAFNTETIYARAVSSVRSCHVLDTNQLLSYELAQHASSRFDSIGLMHELKTKANLRNALKLKLSARPTEKASWCDFSMGVQSWVDALTYQWHCAGLFE